MIDTSSTQVDRKKVFPVRIVKFVIAISSSINKYYKQQLTHCDVSAGCKHQAAGDTAVTSRQVNTIVMSSALVVMKLQI